MLSWCLQWRSSMFEHQPAFSLCFVLWLGLIFHDSKTLILIFRICLTMIFILHSVPWSQYQNFSSQLLSLGKWPLNDNKYYLSVLYSVPAVLFPKTYWRSLLSGKSNINHVEIHCFESWQSRVFPLLCCHYPGWARGYRAADWQGKLSPLCYQPVKCLSACCTQPLSHTHKINAWSSSFLFVV